MTTKDALLKLFESNKGIYLSGEEIAAELSVSRAAVWKAVNTLRSDGYCIDAATKRGYCLSVHTDILSSQGIEKYLDDCCRDLDIQVLAKTDSTNAQVRQKANAGAAEGFTLLANAQTEGRGRLGRSFYSPNDTGIYLSLLLRPNRFPAQQSVRITTMAAAAMCRAIEEVCGETPGIKWVNDIFLRGKKVCGILTEGAFGLENGILEYAVVGVGINVYPPQGGFPDEIREIAGALSEQSQSDLKNHLAAAFLNHFMHYYHSADPSEYLEAYRRYSIVVGQRVTVHSPCGSCSALVLGIDDLCRLQLRYPDGREATLSSGEISIQI